MECGSQHGLTIVQLARPPTSMLLVSPPLILYTGSDMSSVEVGGLLARLGVTGKNLAPHQTIG